MAMSRLGARRIGQPLAYNVGVAEAGGDGGELGMTSGSTVSLLSVPGALPVLRSVLGASLVSLTLPIDSGSDWVSTLDGSPSKSILLYLSIYIYCQGTYYGRVVRELTESKGMNYVLQRCSAL